MVRQAHHERVLGPFVLSRSKGGRAIFRALSKESIIRKLIQVERPLQTLLAGILPLPW